jgi:hypothetical protein
MMQFLLPADLDTTTAICVGIGLAAWVFALVGWSILRRRSRAQSPNENLLDAIIERQSPGSGPSRSVPDACRPAGSGPQLSALEGHLRNAVFDVKARERLVQNAPSPWIAPGHCGGLTSAM